MYNDFIDSEVVVVVSGRNELVWEYVGILCSIDENSLKLKNVEITPLLLNQPGNAFASIGLSVKNKNISEVVLNKEYVVSCCKK